jgi:hypothetical protein
LGLAWPIQKDLPEFPNRNKGDAATPFYNNGLSFDRLSFDRLSFDRLSFDRLSFDRLGFTIEMY